MQRHLPEDQITKVHKAAIEVGLDRHVLLQGLDRRFVASLRTASSVGGQLWDDLHTLNETEALADGSIPIVHWLQAAAHLAGPRLQARVFREALGMIGAAAAPAVAFAAPAGPAAAPAFQASSPVQAPVTVMVPPGAGVARPAPGGGAAGRGVRPRRAGAVRVYLSASADDVGLIDRLRTHMAQLVRQRMIDPWHAGRATAGSDHAAVARQRLDVAEVVLLLVSPSFLADDRTYDEALRALAGIAQGKRVIPVVLRHCEWRSTPFGALSPIPMDGRPIAALPDAEADMAYSAIVAELRSIAEELGVPAA